MAHRRADGRLGKPAERSGLLLQRPVAGQFGYRGEKRDATLGAAQAAHQGCRVFADIFGFFDSPGDFFENRVGALLDEAGQKDPFLDREAAQKGTVAENRREEASSRGCRAQRAGQIGSGVALCQDSASRQDSKPSAARRASAGFGNGPPSGEKVR